MATNNPVFKAALTCLAERAPAALSFRELCAATRDRMAETGIAQPVPDARVPAFVAHLLRRAALGRIVELHVGRSNVSGTHSQSPLSQEIRT